MEFFSSPHFSSHIDELMKRNNVPGLAIAVVQGDEIASAGYGNASLDPAKSCTADTLFDIGSSTKSLTAAAIALLVDDNENYPEVQYDAIMSELLPDDFVMSDVCYTESVTIDDILGHRTGMPGHDDSYMGVRAGNPDNARSITRNLRNLPVAAPLRSRYMYCNMMYTVATHLIEVKSKHTFSEFLSERIFRPLEMTSSSPQPSSAYSKGHGDRIANGHFWNKETLEYAAFQPSDCPEGQGAGSVISSANDLIKWVKALVNREGPITERLYHGLLRMRSFRNPSSKRLKKYTSPGFYAAGIEIYYYRGYAVVWHDGHVAGFASRFFFLPDLRFGAAIMGNSSGAGPVATTIARELIDDALNVPKLYPPPYTKGQKGKGGKKRDLVLNPKKKFPTTQRGASGSKLNEKGGNGEDGEKNDTCSGGDDEKQQEISSSDSEKMNGLPIQAYIGSYWHPGYREMKVQTKDGKLFIDATDRSMAFTLTFERLGPAKFVAHLSDFWEGGDDSLEAEFVVEEDRVIKMGLELENCLNELIWFEKVEENDGCMSKSRGGSKGEMEQAA